MHCYHKCCTMLHAPRIPKPAVVVVVMVVVPIRLTDCIVDADTDKTQIEITIEIKKNFTDLLCLLVDRRRDMLVFIKSS